MGQTELEGGAVQQPSVIWGVLVAIVVGAIGVLFWFFNRQAEPAGNGIELNLPSSVEGWHRAPAGRHYDAESIFSYINGHAEVYLAYGMRGCSAERYTGPDGQPDLILDIFEMASPADAFGVFTHDTEGEAVGIGRDSRYRYGWLSFWQGPNFVSIVAEGETELAEQATLELGRQVASLLPSEGTAPSILEALPEAGLELRSVRYLHHPQILNTHLPIDPENLLDLGMDTEAVLGTYRRDSEGAYLLIVDYPDENRAIGVENRVLEELAAAERDRSIGEDTFAGCRREGNRLAVALETPSEEWVGSLLQAAFD